MNALDDRKECLSQKCEYWFFSKLDEIKDKGIYIPYIVDPKGNAYTDYELKVDGYERVFTDNGVPKVFNYGTYKVEVRLKLFGNPEQVGKKYRSYWVDGKELFKDICEIS
ncbi:hypothetical protein [Hydrogenobacter hydrogenophilus]|uniref:hypothetical protein n=1 Tax=Hydrogenobacter hydrogenophilus TaxID=35835 RepID=UPI000BBC6E46|nr:hypothetical protein [Hydrogenobacter hydrogenophilus]